MKSAIVPCVSMLFLLFIGFAAYSYISSIWLFAGSMMKVGWNDARYVSGSISSLIEIQITQVLFILPGAILAGVAVLKLKYRQLWYMKFIGVVAYVSMFLFPVFTMLGLYLLWLKKVGATCKRRHQVEIQEALR